MKLVGAYVPKQLALLEVGTLRHIKRAKERLPFPGIDALAVSDLATNAIGDDGKVRLVAVVVARAPQPFGAVEELLQDLQLEGPVVLQLVRLEDEMLADGGNPCRRGEVGLEQHRRLMDDDRLGNDVADALAAL